MLERSSCNLINEPSYPEIIEAFKAVIWELWETSPKDDVFPEFALPYSLEETKQALKIAYRQSNDNFNRNFYKQAVYCLASFVPMEDFMLYHRYYANDPDVRYMFAAKDARKKLNHLAAKIRMRRLVWLNDFK